MKVAYIDTSCLVAILFAEPGWEEVTRILGGFDRLISASLLDAELRSASAREGGAERTVEILSWISWVIPDRLLTAEIEHTLAADWQKGADLLHLATALYMAPDPGELSFLTLDRRQRQGAVELGFVVPLRAFPAAEPP